MTSKRIKILTDSTADIPPQIAAERGIIQVPVYVNIGDESYPDDHEHLPRETFFEQLPSMKPLPTTAAPSPGDTAGYIEAALGEADHVIIVSLPQRLSGTYEAFRLGTLSTAPDRVTIIDSESLSMAQGYQALIAAEVATATGDVAQVVAALDRARPHIRLAGIIDSLEYLRRSGRVNFAAAGLGTLLQIKPIITVIESEVRTLTRVRTTRRARQELVNMAHELAPLERLALLHSNDLEGIEWLREQLADIMPPEVFTVNVNTAMGTYTGPNCLGFVTVSQAWRQ